MTVVIDKKKGTTNKKGKLLGWCDYTPNNYVRSKNKQNKAKKTKNIQLEWYDNYIKSQECDDIEPEEQRLLNDLMCVIFPHCDM